MALPNESTLDAVKGTNNGGKSQGKTLFFYGITLEGTFV
jgi:hypothetical protein